MSRNLTTKYKKFVNEVKKDEKNKEYQNLIEKGSSNRKIFLSMDEYYNYMNKDVVKKTRKPRSRK